MDGALFIFVVATDPECCLLLEAYQDDKGSRYRYAVAPMTIFQLDVRYKDRPVWSIEPRNAAGARPEQVGSACFVGHQLSELVRGLPTRNLPMARRESRRPTRKTGLTPVVGIAWYDSAQWTKLKQIAADTEQLDDTHEEWKRNVEQTKRQLAADRVPPVFTATNWGSKNDGMKPTAKGKSAKLTVGSAK